ncbi:cell division cycle protein 23 homolog [Daktulosphaira vitifoliae]|nr:cell division cycle protein 23 homolog [Daktulosphaira vitifoliae]
MMAYHDVDQFDSTEDYLIYSKARSYYETEEYYTCAHVSKNSNNPETMFLHYMARYISLYNQSIYERTNLFEEPKLVDMQRNFILLLDELLIFTVYGGEDDEVEDDIQSQSSFISEMEDDEIDLKINVNQQNESTPIKRCSSRRRSNLKPMITNVQKKTISNKNNKSSLFRKKNVQSKVSVTFDACKSLENGCGDPYLLWLAAVMLKKVDRCEEATRLLIESLEIQPCHWGAWLELSTLIKDIKMLEELKLQNHPNHWMHLIFLAHVYLDFQLTDKALQIYNDILQYGNEVFQKWPYLRCQLAISYHNKREIVQSVNEFINVLQLDPYRLDNIDLLSNLMYVCDHRDQLIVLSKHASYVDRYRQETLCILGNMYSLKCDHAKSVLYFKKALRMNPSNVTAWTLLGHEYIEMKNSYAAIASYRQSLQINIKDYRAWYGLGQIYELVKLPNYALYYFSQAYTLRPHDSRMLVALGEMYERTDRICEALTCYYKALRFDTEGSVLFKIAKFYEKYCDNSNSQVVCDNFHCLNKIALKNALAEKASEKIINLILAKIYLYLGHHYLDQNNYEKSFAMADKCRSLCIEEQNTDNKNVLELQENVNSLVNEIESRVGVTGNTSGSSSAGGPLRARRFLFAL